MFEKVLKFYKDFPTEGINFVDIIPFLQDKETFKALMAEIEKNVDAPNIAAPEARGFLFAAPLLVGDNNVQNIIPFRKKGKLPYSGDDLVDIAITKEYGADHLFYRKSDLAAGVEKDGVIEICILDDVLATGGTAEGIAKSLEAQTIRKGGKDLRIKVTEFLFLVELDGLDGRERLERIAPVKAIMHI